MRVLVAIPCWGRPEVLERVLASLRAQKTGHEVEIICGLSPEDPHIKAVVEACKKHGAHISHSPNKPLGMKWNLLAQRALNLEWDYMLCTGSDDVVSPNFIDAFPWGEGHAAFGWADVYFFGGGKLYHWPGYGERRDESIGAGRIVRRDVVEQMEGRMWQYDKSRGLDGSMSTMLKKRGVSIPYTHLPEGVYLVDVKTEESITPLQDYFDAGDALREVEVPECLMEYLLP